jgi:hypothetical protein
MKINILYRFKNYPHLVVDDNKNIWVLPYFSGKRTKSLRKLSYYEPRQAYRYNNGYLKKETLYKLIYRVNEVYGQEISNYPF